MLTSSAFHPTSLRDAIQQAASGFDIFAVWDRYNIILDSGPPLAGSAIITDFGCGPGLLSKQIARRFGGSLQCFDPSEEMLSYHKEWTADTLPSAPAPERITRTSDPNTLIPCDICFCTWVLQHADANLPETLAAISGATRIGGLLVTVDWDGFDMGPDASLLRVYSHRFIHGGDARSCLSVFLKVAT